MYIFCASVFLSAGLLFQIQPIIAKYILPWFGGATNVWTICLIFFQAILLLGYLYAHLLSKYKTAFHQAVLHSILVAIAVVVSLPIKPDAALQPVASADPRWAILLLLLLTIGLPYLLISASGPLLQSWCQKKFPERSIYRLYALSNAGSLLGLLAYPFLIEPFFTLDTQTYLWSAGFLVYWTLCLLCVALLKSLRNDDCSNEVLKAIEPSDSGVSLIKILLWICLAAIATTLLLATTNQMTLDIASVPLLWILPLSLYLISFIVCFDKPRWYLRKVWIPIMFASVMTAMAAILLQSNSSLLFQVLAYSSILFSGCMVSHGELYRLRPHPSHLTLFYLCISFGGVLGGMFVGLIAPVIFSGYWEVPLVWVLLFVVTGLCLFREANFKSRAWDFAANVSWSIACVVLGVALFANMQLSKEGVIWQKRGFYGVLKLKDMVYEQNDDQSLPIRKVRMLTNGAIIHGSQLLSGDELLSTPTAYYTKNSGVGLAIHNHDSYDSELGLSVGVVGMGAATIASLCEHCKELTFFEIDPNVVTVAEAQFSNLSEARERGAQVDIVLGDARVSLNDADQSYDFDVLAIDAFSGDAIPIHLLTKEALEIYFRHLKPDGVLAMHLSNRHLNLVPVVSRVAQYLGKTAAIIGSGYDEKIIAYPATWILLTSNQNFLGKIDFPIKQCVEFPFAEASLWTDQYSNILRTFISSSGKRSRAENVCYSG